MIKLRELFFICFKIGALLLGGGYVIVPLLRAEFVEKRNCLTNEELINFYALAQCIPGIIAPNTVIFIGYKLCGKIGAIVCALGLALAPFVTILLIASFVGVVLDLPIIKSAFWGVNIAIIVLLLLTVKEIWQTSIVDKLSLILFLLMFILCAVGVSPVWVIIGAILIGLLRQKIKGESAQ